MPTVRASQRKSRGGSNAASPAEAGSDSDTSCRGGPTRADSSAALPLAATSALPREGVDSRPPGAFIGAVLDKVIGGLNLEGLRAALAERVAAKVMSSVREDDLVEALAARVETALSERICSRVADRILES